MKTIATKNENTAIMYPSLFNKMQKEIDMIKIGNTSRTLSFTSSVVSVWWKYCVIPIIKEDKIITDNSKGPGIPISPFSISNEKQFFFQHNHFKYSFWSEIMHNLHIYNSVFIMIISNNYNYSNVVIFIFNLRNPANISRQNMRYTN